MCGCLLTGDKMENAINIGTLCVAVSLYVYQNAVSFAFRASPLCRRRLLAGTLCVIVSTAQHCLSVCVEVGVTLVSIYEC